MAIAGACILMAAGLYLLKKKTLLDWYGNALFSWLIVWKLSVIIFQLPMVVKQPLSLLYFHGGIKGYWLGLIVAVLYTFIKVRSNQLSVIPIYHTWIASVILYELLLACLNQASLLIIFSQLLTGSLFYILMIFKAQLIWKKQVLILYTGTQAIIYSFDQSLISVSMLTYIVMVVFLVGVLHRWEDTQ